MHGQVQTSSKLTLSASLIRCSIRLIPLPIISPLCVLKKKTCSLPPPEAIPPLSRDTEDQVSGCSAGGDENLKCSTSLMEWKVAGWDNATSSYSSSSLTSDTLCSSFELLLDHSSVSFLFANNCSCLSRGDFSSSLTHTSHIVKDCWRGERRSTSAPTTTTTTTMTTTTYDYEPSSIAAALFPPPCLLIQFRGSRGGGKGVGGRRTAQCLFLRCV